MTATHTETIERTEIDEARHLVRVAAAALEGDDFSSAAWRLADALGLIRDYGSTGLLMGCHEPTGRGYRLAD